MPLGWDGLRVCPLCGICIANIYADGPRGSWKDREEDTKVVRAGDGICFQWAVGLFADFETPIGRIVSDILPGKFNAQSVVNHISVLDGSAPPEFWEHSDSPPMETLPNFPEAAEDSDEDAPLLPFRNAEGFYDSYDPRAGGLVPVHPGCISLACAWTGVPVDNPREFFTHPTGGSLLTCSCLTYNSSGFGIENVVGSEMVEQERELAGLRRSQACQFGRHHLHTHSPADGRYFDERVLFHDIDYGLTFDPSRWEPYDGEIDPPMEASDEWVLVRPDRFPTLTIIAVGALDNEVVPSSRQDAPFSDSSDKLSNLPIDVILRILEFTLQPDNDRDADASLMELQCTSRRWNEFFTSHGAAAQLHFRMRCQSMGLVPTVSDKKRRAMAFNDVMAQAHANNAAVDWVAYHKACKRSASMRNRHRIHRIVRKAFRVMHVEEFRTEELYPDSMFPNAFA
ncbi:uncharacterized protein EV422DRAFT_572617 [Fimicolochytrium jonesii]|uniref:uncharacterized protein n=1 Tax=Fimicolochytrium jonesii TaxID=1396493 RepID=UPI0022FE1F58|nr:uncharacterized protein EV422DRAFT_572617 [Fimicolochytrium jonesii]KAI8815632.1 hypothetical protein EV422DRAFT_572617 [Fimicolochytrium jonesii]